MAGLKRLAASVAVLALISAAAGAAAGFGTSQLVKHFGASPARPEPWGTLLTSKLPDRWHGDPQLAISPSFSADHAAVLATPDGVIATTDGGASWHSLGFAGQAISAMAMSPNFHSGVSGAVYVATTEPTTPNGVVGNGSFGNAQVWFTKNLSHPDWVPTRVYGAPGGIDALAVNGLDQLLMSVPGSAAEGSFWLEWGVTNKGTPKVSVRGPGLWISPDAGMSWAVDLADDPGTCGLGFDPLGQGYFFDTAGNAYETTNNASSWLPAPFGPANLGSLADLTLPSWHGPTPGSYLLGLSTPTCGTQPPGTLVYSDQQLTALEGQDVLAIAADWPFAIPGHNRGIAFAATSHGVYLGGEDSLGDFWDLLPGSPGGCQALAAGEVSSTEAVVLCLSATSVSRLEISWPPDLPGVDMAVSPLGSSVSQGQTNSAVATLKSIDGFAGTVSLSDADTALSWGSTFSMSSAPVRLAAGSSQAASYSLAAAPNATLGTFSVLPVASALDGSAYTGALTQVVTITSPPVELTLAGPDPGSLSVRGGQAATSTLTVATGPNWTPTYASVELLAPGALPQGVTLAFTPSVGSLGPGSSVQVTVSVGVDQLAKLGPVVIPIEAQSANLQLHTSLRVDILAPVPSSFTLLPQPPPNRYRFQAAHLSIHALGANGAVLTNYTGFWATLTDERSALDGVGSGPIPLYFHAGVAECSYFIATPGTDRLLVRDSSGAPSSFSATFQVELPPVGFALARISRQVLGVPFTVTVRAVDAAGETVSLYSGRAWIADRSGLLFQRIGPFIDGIWTGKLAVPVVVTNDTLSVGDPSGDFPYFGALYGQSNAFDVVLPSPLASPGTWADPGYDGGSTYDNPSALLSSSSYSKRQLAFSVSPVLGKACAIPSPSQPAIDLCRTIYALGGLGSAGSSAPAALTDSLLLDGGVLIPGWLAGLNAGSGKLLWLTHENHSSTPVESDGKVAVCSQSTSSPWWPSPTHLTTGLIQPPGGMRAVTLLGANQWRLGTTCSNLTAAEGTFFAVVPLGQATTYSKAPGAANPYVATPPVPLGIQAVLGSTGSSLWKLPFPAQVGEAYWDPVLGGNYEGGPVLRVTASPSGLLVIASGHDVSGCAIKNFTCVSDNSPGLKAWIGVAQAGHWLWRSELGRFPYSSGAAHEEVLDPTAFELAPQASKLLKTAAERKAERQKILASFLSASGFQGVTTLAGAAQHLTYGTVSDLAASQGTLYLSTTLDDPKGQDIAQGIIAIDAQDAKPIWEEVLWGSGYLDLVVTPHDVLALSPSPSGTYLTQPARYPGPPSTENQANAVLSIHRASGALAYTRLGLPAFAAAASGLATTHPSAGGELLFDGGYVIDATTGAPLGPLPGSTGGACDNLYSRQDGIGWWTRSTVAVAGNWIYYVPCAAPQRIYAVKLPAGNVALYLAEQAYARALDPPTSLAGRARYAEIAAKLFQAAGNAKMAQRAAALARKLGWHDLPTTPPRPRPLPKLSATLKAQVGPVPAGSFPYPTVVGAAVAVLTFLLGWLGWRRWQPASSSQHRLSANA